mmetsp:Transcript_2871/g.7290  ORF Transcript_2871/g.7290 Transcript_2871/m.7290 type:complete len:223 (+) Transcript_2871:1610-2278(+)
MDAGLRRPFTGRPLHVVLPRQGPIRDPWRLPPPPVGAVAGVRCGHRRLVLRPHQRRRPPRPQPLPRLLGADEDHCVQQGVLRVLREPGSVSLLVRGRLLPVRKRVCRDADQLHVHGPRRRLGRVHARGVRAPVPGWVLGGGDVQHPPRLVLHARGGGRVSALPQAHQVWLRQHPVLSVCLQPRSDGRRHHGDCLGAPYQQGQAECRRIQGVLPSRRSCLPPG